MITALCCAVPCYQKSTLYSLWIELCKFGLCYKAEGITNSTNGIMMAMYASLYKLLALTWNDNIVHYVNDAVASLDVRIDDQRPRHNEIAVSYLVFPIAQTDGSVIVCGKSNIGFH